MSVTRLLGAMLLIALTVGCRVQIDTPAAGEVTTQSGRHGCMPNSNCEIDVRNTEFEEVFYAIAKPLYRFEGWRTGEGYFCGGNATPCPLSTVPFENNESLMSLLESDEVYYLAPEFAPLRYRLSEYSVSLDTASDANLYLVALAADLNHDGLDDFIFGGPLWEDGFVNKEVEIDLMINNGNYGFRNGIAEILVPGEPVPRLVHPGGVEISDFNDDGFKDLVIIGTGHDAFPYDGEPNILLLSGANGKYYNAAPGTEAFDYRGMSHDVAVGDFNQDGHQDIVVADLMGLDVPGCNNMIRLLFNDGTANFRTEFSGFIGGLSGNTCHFWTTVEVADLDGDDFPDLILGTGNTEFGSSFVVWNNGDGGFDAATRLPLRANQIVGETEVIDLNDDNLPDIVVSTTQHEPFYEGRYLKPYLNKGGREFEAKASDAYFPDLNTEGVWISDMYTMDIDLDGSQDLFLESGNDWREPLVGSGAMVRQLDGTFTSWGQEIFPLRDRASEPRFGGLHGLRSYPIDADGDGDWDFLQVHSSPANNLSVWDLLINEE